MYCPMKFNANTEVINDGYVCDEEKCAWWDGEGYCLRNLGWLIDLKKKD